MSDDERIEADYAEPVSYEDLARVVTEPERLRAENQRLETNWTAEVKLRKALGNQAAQLKAENQRLRDALERIRDSYEDDDHACGWFTEVAREALAGDAE